MKKSLLGAAIVVLVFIAAAAYEYRESAHQKRFHAYMEANQIEYSDLGCQIGWDATAPDTGFPLVVGMLGLCFVVVILKSNKDEVN